jgi:hypothetical protein
MYRLSSSLICGVIAVPALGLLDPNVGSTSNAGLNASSSTAAAVNRAAKSDRLASPHMVFSSEAWKTEFNARLRNQTKKGAATDPVEKRDETKRAPAKMPVGCEAAVSIALDDDLARTPSRCISSLPISEPAVG